MTKQKRNGLIVVGALVALVVVALVVIFSSEEDDGTVRMARANWDSGYAQAEIYAALIEELGYEVTEPSEHELGPLNFYPALRAGQYDLWANGWFPNHELFLDYETVAGLSSDGEIEAVGVQVGDGGREGYMVDKATADRLGLTSMSQLSDPAIAAEFDTDGDGNADLYGCNADWGCAQIIDGHIADNDWGANVEQNSGIYNELVAEVQARVDAAEPVLFYGWTPNWTYTVLTPDDNVVWLDSPFRVNDIRAVGNTDFLDSHPDVRSLLEQVKIDLGWISAQNERMAAGGYTQGHIRADAEQWIEENRSKVNGWLENARAAG